MPVEIDIFANSSAMSFSHNIAKTEASTHHDKKSGGSC